MPIAELYTNTASIGTVEYSLPNNSTTPASITDDGVYQVWIDAATMTVTEEYEISIKEKATSGGTQRLVYHGHIAGVQTSNWVSPSLILLHGWDVTMKKIAGTDRSFSWSIRQVA